MRRGKKHTHWYTSIWRVIPHRARGDTLVEFALLLPTLMLILMGIFDLGRGFYAYNVIANAAREGARYGVAHPDDRDAIEGAAEALIVGLDSEELDITVCPHDGVPPCPVDQPSDTVRVEITYDFYAVTPLITQFFGGQEALQLKGVATMYVE